MGQSGDRVRLFLLLVLLRLLGRRVGVVLWVGFVVL